MKSVMRLENTPLFMEQLEPYEILRNYFHIIDPLKAQLRLCLKNTIESVSPVIITNKKSTLR